MVTCLAMRPFTARSALRADRLAVAVALALFSWARPAFADIRLQGCETAAELCGERTGLTARHWPVADPDSQCMDGAAPRTEYADNSGGGSVGDFN